MKPKRLTEKKNGLFLTKQPFPEMIDKLGQLEDIEQYCGIDIVTLFKALKNGIWIKYDSNFGEGKPKIVIQKDTATGICWRDRKWWIEENDFLLKDYGKTWALTKEELQK